MDCNAGLLIEDTDGKIQCEKVKQSIGLWLQPILWCFTNRENYLPIRIVDHSLTCKTIPVLLSHWASYPLWNQQENIATLTL